MSETVITDSGKTSRFNSTRATASLPFSCRCGIRWSGTRTCHCATEGCHKTFSGESTFSRHRRDGRCLDPADVGMSLMPGRSFECWGYPGEAAE